MAVPSSDRVIYRHNPIKEVICQLRFPSILEVVASEPVAFQNAIRQKYPLYELASDDLGLPEEVKALLTKVNQPPFGERRHLFRSEDQKDQVVLANSFVAFTTSSYSRWESFYNQLSEIVGIFESVYQPAFYQRIGLRYQDEIKLEVLGISPERKEWGGLIRSEFLGFLGHEETSSQTNSFLSVTELSLDNNCKAKVQLGIGQDNRSPVSGSFLVDIDIFTDQRVSRGDTHGLLSEFNRSAGNIFRWIITDRLASLLGSE